jgi:hypothetical protein
LLRHQCSRKDAPRGAQNRPNAQIQFLDETGPQGLLGTRLGDLDGLFLASAFALATAGSTPSVPKMSCDLPLVCSPRVVSQDNHRQVLDGMIAIPSVRQSRMFDGF